MSRRAVSYTIMPYGSPMDSLSSTNYTKIAASSAPAMVRDFDLALFSATFPALSIESNWSLSI